MLHACEGRQDKRLTACGTDRDQHRVAFALNSLSCDEREDIARAGPPSNYTIKGNKRASPGTRGRMRSRAIIPPTDPARRRMRGCVSAETGCPSKVEGFLLRHPSKPPGGHHFGVQFVALGEVTVRNEALRLEWPHGGENMFTTHATKKKGSSEV